MRSLRPRGTNCLPRVCSGSGKPRCTGNSGTMKPEGSDLHHCRSLLRLQFDRSITFIFLIAQNFWRALTLSDRHPKWCFVVLTAHLLVAPVISEASMSARME